MLQMSAAHLQQICDHAQRTYPEECCGLLLGHLEPNTDRKKLVEVWETLNAWEVEQKEAVSCSSDSGQRNSKADRYRIDPEDLLQAQQYGRDRQLNVIGIYHSHPDHSAMPSECDRAIAWSSYSYLIISVAQGRAIDHRSWRLDDRHQFQPEALVSLDPAPPQNLKSKI